jgi:hypothetical protein
MKIRPFGEEEEACWMDVWNLDSEWLGRGGCGPITWEFCQESIQSVTGIGEEMDFDPGQ